MRSTSANRRRTSLRVSSASSPTPRTPKPRSRASLLAALVAVCVLTGAAPAAPQPVVRFAFTCDIAMVDGPAGTYFRLVALDLTVDVVLGNLEGTLTAAGSTKCGSASSN